MPRKKIEMDQLFTTKVYIKIFKKNVQFQSRLQFQFKV